MARRVEGRMGGRAVGTKMIEPSTNDVVQQYWERNPCGISPLITAGAPAGTRRWFERIEDHRYQLIPHIHAVAQFTRHRGKKILEIGVGAGTDHLQWARAGARCVGVDLTDAAIELTRAHLAMHGFESDLRRADAEALPFPDESFDLVYSWGVIHHSEQPAKIVSEIHRVLRPGGTFIGMLYGRRSVVAFKQWVKYALLRGRPWRTFGDVIWHHMESLGTKAYTVPELHHLFSAFRSCEAQPILSAYDITHWPRWLSKFFPDSWGWEIAVEAVK